MSQKKDLLLLLLLALAAILLTIFTLVRKYEHNTNFQTSQLNPFHKLAKKQTKDIPVYLYHYVEHVTDERDFIRESLNIPPEIFEAQVISLKNAGYTFIFPNEIPDLDFSSEEKYVVVSFDDGYADFYTDVLPILRKHQIKAVNYVVFNFIGKLNYMTKAQLQKVVKSG